MKPESDARTARWPVLNREGLEDMWCFSWVLGLGLALTFGVLNAIWYEMRDTVRR